MERLTERDFQGNKLVLKNSVECTTENIKKWSVNESAIGSITIRGEAVDKLAAYEDAEEQGLLVKLPCKVGDTVWDNDFGKPCAYTITGFSLGTGEDYIDEPVSEKEIVYYCSNSSGSITESFAAIEIGKTVFLTQDEAEQKLKEMKS